MLKIIMEFRKGILFVRLYGTLNKLSIQKFERNVTDKIKKNQIANVVFNVENLKEIDLKGINSLFYIYEIISMFNGEIFISNTDYIDSDLKKMKVYKYITHINSEIDVFKMVKI